MGLAYAVATEIRLGFVKMGRYPVQTLSSLIVLYMLFVGLFYGARAMTADTLLPPSSGPAARALMGFFLWYLALFAIDSMSQTVAEEAQTGTLEQLYLARWPFPLMLFIRFLASLTTGLAMAVPLFFVLKVSTGAALEVEPAWALSVVAVTTLGLCGFGYILAALTLLFKRIGNAISIVQFGLLFLALTPIERLAPPIQLLAITLPLAQGVRLLRAGLGSDGAPPADGAQFLLLTANALGYLLIGVAFLHWAERQSRVRGLLGHY